MQMLLIARITINLDGNLEIQQANRQWSTSEPGSPKQKSLVQDHTRSGQSIPHTPYKYRDIFLHHKSNL